MKYKLLLSALALIISGTLFSQSAPASIGKKNCGMVASAGTHTGTSEISVTELKEIKALSIKTDCESDNYRIISYEFAAVNKAGQPVELKGTGASLTGEMMMVLSRLESNSKIYFDNITAKRSDGSTKKIPGITLKVK